MAVLTFFGVICISFFVGIAVGRIDRSDKRLEVEKEVYELLETAIKKTKEFKD